MKTILALEPWRVLVLLVPLGVALSVATYTDLRERKVYNWLTYPTVLLGLALHGIAMGWAGLGAGLLAACLMLVAGLFLIATPAISGGDIKLMIGIGAFLGGRALLEITFYAVFAGFFIGLAMSLATGYFWTMVRNLWRLIKGYTLMLVYRSKNLRPELEEDDRRKVPFASALLAGLILTVTEYQYDWPGLLTWYLEQMGWAG